jgi:hypothetical protein
MKQSLRKKIANILSEARVEGYTLFYSSLLDQLYVLYILLGGTVLLLFAHLSIWPILVLLIYMVIAYLFGAYRNNSVAITASQLIIINGRTPFSSIRKINVVDISNVFIGRNLHPLLDRIFIIPSNVYVTISFINQSKATYYTNIDFADDAKQGQPSLEDLAQMLVSKGVTTVIEEKDDLYD